jgi:hypothetical protein
MREKNGGDTENERKKTTRRARAKARNTIPEKSMSNFTLKTYICALPQNICCRFLIEEGFASRKSLWI